MRNIRCSCVPTSNCAQLAPATKVLISSNCLSCVTSGRLLPPARARHRRSGAGASRRRAAQVRSQGAGVWSQVAVHTNQLRFDAMPSDFYSSRCHLVPSAKLAAPLCTWMPTSWPPPPLLTWTATERRSWWWRSPTSMTASTTKRRWGLGHLTSQVLSCQLWAAACKRQHACAAVQSRQHWAACAVLAACAGRGSASVVSGELATACHAT